MTLPESRLSSLVARIVSMRAAFRRLSQLCHKIVTVLRRVPKMEVGFRERSINCSSEIGWIHPGEVALHDSPLAWRTHFHDLARVESDTGEPGPLGEAARAAGRARRVVFRRREGRRVAAQLGADGIPGGSHLFVTLSETFTSVTLSSFVSSAS